MAKLFKMLRVGGRGRIYPYTKQLFARKDMVAVLMTAEQIKEYNQKLTPAEQAPLREVAEGVYDDGIAVVETADPTPAAPAAPAAPAVKPLPPRPVVKKPAKKPVVAKPSDLLKEKAGSDVFDK